MQPSFKSILEDEVRRYLTLDIQLPGLSGLDLVQSVGIFPYVIFVTSRRLHALQAFEFKDKIIDFITLKPVIMQRLSMPWIVYELAMNDQPPFQPGPVIRSEGIVRLDLNNYIYIETKGIMWLSLRKKNSLWFIRR